MANVLLIILLILSVILTGLILIQRSEGGALGIGGGGGGGGLMSGRGTADMVQKLTAWLGAAFLGVCLLISISFNFENRDRSLLDTTNAETPLLETTDSENKALNETPDSAKGVTPLDQVAGEVDSGTPDAGDSPQNKDEKPE